MEQETTLSIIIPLYNCEKYIKHCLDSILAQGLNKSDFEIIIVDDGSVDNSYAIASAYATDHDNIIVVRQENQGVACTRNNALKMAKGNYVTFVDADDMLVGGSLAKLLRIAMENKAEMVKAAHIEVPQEALFEGYSCNGSSTELMSGDDAIVKVTKLKEGYCWGYLISRRLIADHNLCFPAKGVVYGRLGIHHTSHAKVQYLYKLRCPILPLPPQHHLLCGKYVNRETSSRLSFYRHRLQGFNKHNWGCKAEADR